MNEETILKNNQMAVGQQTEEKKHKDAWKQVTIGGISGILMGAGMLYGGQVVAKRIEAEDAPDSGGTGHTLENGLQVAAVSDELSFGEAFAQARAEVGPDGVFHWHGGIYNTYTAAEWNAMTIEQKHEFAQQVQPEIHPNDLSTPTDADTHVVVVHHVYHHDEEQQAVPTSDDVQVAIQQPVEDSDSDVHIVGYTTVHGHLTVGLDMDDDGQPDVAIIDVDDNQELSDPDLVVDKYGNSATIGEINNNSDPNMDAVNDTPNIDDGAQTDVDYPVFDV